MGKSGISRCIGGKIRIRLRGALPTFLHVVVPLVPPFDECDITSGGRHILEDIRLAGNLAVYLINPRQWTSIQITRRAVQGRKGMRRIQHDRAEVEASVVDHSRNDSGIVVLDELCAIKLELVGKIFVLAKILSPIWIARQ
jgi:hypothetical protein